MNKNLPLVLFFFIMSFVSVSSSQNWFFLWVSMELNTFAFLTLMAKSKSMKSDNLILYFSVQTLSSFMLVLMFLSCETKSPNTSISLILLVLAMFMKMGVAPLHNWSIPVGVMTTPFLLIIFLTAQKIFPFLLLKTYTNLLFFFFVILFSLSVLVGSTQNFHQNSLKMIIIFSSISHLGWLTMSLMNISTWEFYFFFYCSISTILLFLLKKNLKLVFSENNNMMMILLFLTLGGLPPLMGFYPKILILKTIVFMEMALTLLTILLFSILDLFVYTRTSVLGTLKNKTKTSWNKKKKWPEKMLILMSILTLFFVCV